MLQKYNTIEFIWFHKPNFLDSRIPKKKAISHCIHMMFDVYGERFTRFSNWFDVQKHLGIDRFRLYFFRINQTSEEMIRKKVGKHAEIFHSRLDKPFICRHYITFLENQKSEIADYLMKNCEDMFSVYFDWNREGVFNAHEKVCTNDCLLNFKWTHEFTTNYDFDEFIFPRRLDTNFLTKSKNSTSEITCESQVRDYTLYDYAVDLSSKSSTPVAVLLFKHVLFFHNDHKNFHEKLFKIVDKNK